MWTLKKASLKKKYKKKKKSINYLFLLTKVESGGFDPKEAVSE